MALLRRTTKFLALSLLLVAPLALGGIYRNMTPIKKAQGAPPFSPSDLTGRILHFYAESGNVSLTGSDVNQWNDLSGNARHATSGAATKPTYSTSAVNGKDAITFTQTGLGQTLGITNTALLSGARATTLYMVFKHSSFFPSVTANIFFTAKIGSSVNFPCFGYDHGTLSYFFSGEAADVSQPVRWAVAEDTTSWHSAAFLYNGSGYGTASNSSMYFDKSLQTTSSFGSSQYGDGNTFGSFTNPVGGATYSFPGQIAFFILLDHAIDGTERANLDAWVLSTYGI